MSAPWDEDMVNLLKVNADEMFRDSWMANLKWTPEHLEAVELRLLSKVDDDDAALLLIHNLSSGWTVRRMRGIIEDIAQRRAGAPGSREGDYNEVWESLRSLCTTSDGEMRWAMPWDVKTIADRLEWSEDRVEKAVDRLVGMRVVRIVAEGWIATTQRPKGKRRSWEEEERPRYLNSR